MKGCQVRLGINAPRDVSVNREEIYELIEQGLTGEQVVVIEDEVRE